MTYYDNEIYPVSRITAGAVGHPGQRVFILQARVDGETMSWVIEKNQALALGRSIPQLLQDIRQQFPELDDPLVAAEPNLALCEPFKPVFRVGSIGLGYDRLHDLIVLTLQDAESDGMVELPEGDGTEDAMQIFTTRGQAHLLGRQAEEAVAAGRPLCPNCGEPMDDFGHFCLAFLSRRKGGGDYLQ
jgi:uncharacterized repeat protein (TIGR03847 family)